MDVAQKELFCFGVQRQNGADAHMPFDYNRMWLDPRFI